MTSRIKSVARPHPSIHFDTKHLASNLKLHSVRGGAYTILAHASSFVLRLGSTMILARLLSPRDFGLIAMITAFTGLAQMFKDAGLSMATIQNENITHEQISTLFWINAGLGAILMLIIAALAPLIAAFYKEPLLTWITVSISATLLLGGLSVQHQALLRRQMRFGVLALIQVISQAAGIVVAVLAAYWGARYWALVLNLGTFAFSNTLLVWISSRWMPGLPRKSTGIGKMLALGGNLTVSNFLSYCVRNLDNILIGAAWGAGSLGLYAKAYQLLLLPIQQINFPVSAAAVPALSRLQNDPAQFRSFYMKGISYVTFLGIPIAVFAFVATPEIVLLFLGDKWEGAIPIFRVLAPAAFIGTFNVATGWIFIPLGQGGRQLRETVFGSVLTISAFFIGLRHGAIGVATAFTISEFIKRFPQLLYAYAASPVSILDFFKSIWRQTASSITAAVLTASFQFFVPIDHLVTRLAALTVCYGLGYLFTYCLLPGGRSFLLHFSDSFRMVLNR